MVHRIAYLANITLFGLLSGITGTGIGALIALRINKISNRFMGFILEFSGGLMTSVVCFELIPEAFSLGGPLFTLSGIFLGIIAIMIIENFITSGNILAGKNFGKVKIRKRKKTGSGKNGSKTVKISSSTGNSLLKTGILVAIGIALHNFPEGFAVGSGFQASFSLGTAVTLVIIIHDIPEGIAMALPMSSGGLSKAQAFFYTLLSGVPMGLGALLGAILGSISTNFIAICLGFAGGAMLYIVFVELVPESKKIYFGRFSSIGNLLGIICGIIVTIYN